MVVSPVHQVWPNHFARHSERGKKTRQTEEEVERQHQGMDRPGVRQVPEGSGEKGKNEKTGCEIICGAPTIFAVKGGSTLLLSDGVIWFFPTLPFLSIRVPSFSSPLLYFTSLKLT